MSAPPVAIPSVFDTNKLAGLKAAVAKNDPKALKAAAQQFEALFLQMVLKSMRDATPQDGLFGSDQSRMYESLLDQQLSQVMAARGGTGLAAMIEKQLTQGNIPAEAFEDGLPLTPAPKQFPLSPTAPGMRLDNQPQMQMPLDSAPNAPRGDVQLPNNAKDFVNRVAPQAAEASQATGIPASFLIAHAALETGWGRSEPRLADGRPSYNIFGIKAGRSWNGGVAEAATTEYVDGVAQRQVERFRAYGSYAEAFRDYASLLKSNPRYAGVLGTQNPVTFAYGLQRAGYATDPQYAEKLTRIIGTMAASAQVSTAA